MLALLEDALAQAFLARRMTAVSVVTETRSRGRWRRPAARRPSPTAVSSGTPGCGMRWALLGRVPDGVLFLSADLPTVVAADVDAMIDACPANGIAIGRAHDQGTNALALRPADAIVPAFGSPRSSAVHAALARAGRHRPAVMVDRPGLALDLDTPDDVTEALGVEAFAGRSWRTVVAEKCAC